MSYSVCQKVVKRNSGYPRSVGKSVGGNVAKCYLGIIMCGASPKRFTRLVRFFVIFIVNVIASEDVGI